MQARPTFVVLDDIHDIYDRSEAVARLRARGEVVIYRDITPTEAAVAERLRGAEAVIANRERTRFPRALLERLEGLRLISQTGNGAAHVDLAAATERGIAVAITPGHGPVELTFALILALRRQIVANDHAMHAGAWPLSVGRELHGSTLGIVGLGKLGTGVARVGQAFGMRVIAWSRSLTLERAAAAGVEPVALPALFARADVVSLHLRLTPETRGLIGRNLLRRLRRDAILINTARGAIVDEAALAELLAERAIGGAGLDVFTIEPLPADSPLRRLDNVVLAPHVGWVTEETYRHYSTLACDNILAFIDGRPQHLLNPGALTR